MTRILLGALGLMVFAAQPQQPPPRPPRPQAPSARPVVVQSERNDTSPALRDIPPVAPARRVDPDEREPRLARRIVRDRVVPDPVVQKFPGTSVMPAATLSVEGLGNVNGVLPPDTNAAVGPNHYVQSVNVSFAVFSKGTPTSAPVLLYGPADTSTLWAGFGGPCESRNDGDAIVLYDHLADRWIISQLALPNLFFGIAIAPFYQCLAVSASADPLGGYHRYQFAFNKLNDYPKLAVWPDAYYMAINQFAAVTLEYAGQGVIAFDRAKMLGGLPAAMQYLDLAAVDITLGGMLPADLDGPAPPAGSPGYFVQMDDDAWGYSDDRLQLWRFNVDWANPSATSFTGPALIPVAPFDTNLCDYSRTCLSQRGTTAKVDAMADRLMYRLQYRNFGTHESLVVNHTVDADGTDHAGIRWYEVRNPGTSPVLLQQGTYAPDADHRWMASAAMDSAGNLALGFSVSGDATWPSVRYTGRAAGDPPGVMTQGELELVAGSGSQTHPSGRWGDYSMMAVDPSDDCTFWYTQQYYADTTSADWRTRIGKFSFPSCGSFSALPRVSVEPTMAAAYEAGVAQGAFTVSRTGDASEALSVSYAVGGTATAGTDYVPLAGVLTIPAGAVMAAIPVVPLDDPYAESGEIVSVSINPGAAYQPGSPSQAVVTIVSDDLPADLVMAALMAPSAAAPGASISIGDMTKNQGGGESEPSATGFYLSTNVLFDAADLLLGSRPVAALPVGGSDAGATVVSLPGTIGTGTYYVIAKADTANAIPESNEINNTRFSGAIRIGPDLVVPSFKGVPVVAQAGGTVTVTDTTQNQGSTTAAASTTGVYFSANALLDAGDQLVGSRAVPTLAPNGVSSGTVTIQVPATAGTGTFYLFGKADLHGGIVESSEANNASSAFAIRIGPDLSVSAMTFPANPAAGTTINVTDTTANTGGGSASASTTRFYLSVNLSVDAADPLLGSRDVPALDAGATSSGTTAVVIPAGTAAGSYWLIAVADSTGAVVETSETNNVRFAFIRVTVGG
ncbi:MAG TPA: CARDB domain-containing protein [Vicinamibacterales bacterium]|nr:CARDB domain-containing protein [Vicinamibacterales bacterium]